MNIAQFLARASRLHPNRVALSKGKKVLYSYREFEDRVRRLSRAMQDELNMEKGDRVAIFMPNHPEYIVIRYAAWCAGLSVVPINNKLHTLEVNYILEHSGSKVCFISDEFEAESGENSLASPDLNFIINVSESRYSAFVEYANKADIESVDPGQMAWLFYTSGTTGKPKGVMISHYNMLMGALGYLADVDDIQSEDCIVHAAPLSHGSGFYDLVHVMCFANQVIPDSGGFEPKEVLDLMQVWRGISMFLAPTMVKRMVRSSVGHADATDGLKTIIYGGGPMYLSDIKEAKRVLGPKFVQIYGQGESPMTITVLSKSIINDESHANYDKRLASVGVPQKIVQVEVFGENNRPVDVGCIGEVVVKGSVVASGYWNDDAATENTWKNGWLYTGDVGYMSEDGFLTLVDRSKDLIISGGSNIYPREIEEVLSTHDAVVEVAVVGKESEEWGEDVIAFVVCEPKIKCNEQMLDQFCLDHIARFKRPKKYYFVESLPKNNYGKVLKRELRDRARHES